MADRHRQARPERGFPTPTDRPSAARVAHAFPNAAVSPPWAEWLVACGIALLLAGCAGGPAGTRAGRDGPEAQPPSGLAQVASAQPRVEPIRRSGGTSKPYTVLGRSYVPMVDDQPLRESGLASWYGRKFHGQPTASGERYDMYAMTAAHKTLPLPSYVRVRNPANGRTLIVRVNDRGPFHADRVIDLSYTAALQLDLLRGVAPVEIERITNEDIRTGAWQRGDDARAMADASTRPTPAPAVPEPVPVALTAPVAWTARAEGTALPALAALNTPATTPIADPPGASPASGFWVQLGAFSQRDGAMGLQQQAARDLPALAQALRVFSEQGMHRVQAGPFASREAARSAVEQVRHGLQRVPVVVERR